MSSESLSRLRKTDYRSLIDRYDKQVLNALGHRIQAARQVGKLKKSQAAPVHDAEREKRMLRQRRDWGNSLALPQELIDDLFAVILRHSNRIQEGGL